MILQTENLTKVYRVGKEEVPALRGVNFALDTGEFVVINGPSGSGKTTFLNLIACIDKPTSGEVYIEGQPTSQLSEGQLAELRKRKIGLVFQTFNLIPVLSAYENAEYPLILLGVGRKERYRRTMALLEEVGLKELAHRRPDELSGGQRQRVAIARALVTNPRLVLADEPTANLDSETGKQVMAIMRRLNEEHRVAFLVVTHDPVVTQYAQRTVKIRDGQLFDGSAKNGA
ncbi:MAG: ABC transporter ATP-binding protein [Candidatus Bipolaricaulota bacterium]|nr:ABC transporter ATP-binding protein [Candidatus Bipolaricaulota bacterium]MCS7275085.1 ABC transporter ATP-binding protein [Candidatus Bipolaricaulota bacterium]MDW8110413.1 ABC transporter ATP-binding protein [Candidatus Bipolaricaulota bacterium]MDW8329516.1 ABC transporter ATP-binding protein [Candidatus Bipolaricaulota bacterium]